MENNMSTTTGNGHDTSYDDHHQTQQQQVSTNIVEVFISGMTCTICSNSIENALWTQLESNSCHIVRIDTNLTTDSAEIEFSLILNPSTRESVDDHMIFQDIVSNIKNIIESIGYEVEETKTIQIATRMTRGTTTTTTTTNRDPTTIIISNGNVIPGVVSKFKSTTVNDEESLPLTNVNVPLTRYRSFSVTSNEESTPMNNGDSDGMNNTNQNSNSIHDAQNSPAAASPIMSVEERWQRYRDRQQYILQRKRRAFIVSLIGTIPILVLTMILPYIVDTDKLIFHHKHITLFGKYNVQVQSIVLCFLATPVQFICGYEFYKMAWYGLRVGKAGMDVLVALGTSASFGYAFVMGVLYGDVHAVHFFETSAVLICFVLAGKWMQAVAVRRTSDSLSQLMSLQSKTAIKISPVVRIPIQQKEGTTTNNDDINNNNEKKNQQQSRSSTFNPLVDPYHEEVIDIQNVQVDDIVKIIRGASIPTDGVILFGEVLVNESMVTGESIPALKSPGSLVLGGTVCVETSNSTSDGTDLVDVETVRPQDVGAAFVRVTGVGASTALAQIVKMVQLAQTRAVPIQSFADSVSAIFVPTVCAISLVTYLVWYALCSSHVVPESWYRDELHEDAATFSLIFAIACLVISCPCALGLATPTAVMVGTGVGASHCGVLMKGGQALEIASQVNTIVLDKTGTLTKGTPIVSDFVRMSRLKEIDDTVVINNNNATIQDDNFTSNGLLPADSLSPKNQTMSDDDVQFVGDDDTYLLWLLASVERTSEHPLAKAVVEYVMNRLGSDELDKHPLAQPTQFRAITGRGCKGTVLVDLFTNTAFPRSDLLAEVAVGNRSYAVLSKIIISKEADECMKRLEQQGKTAIFGAVNGEVRVVLGIADELKPDAKAAVYYLRNKLKLDVWMVTGDNSRTATAVALQLNIGSDRVVAEALPATKLAIIRKLQKEKRIVAMVGDGINDSPALAQADVGMSLGSGASEISAEASDMVLVRGDMTSVCTAIHLSRAIFRRIQWNFVFSLLYNCLGIPIAAGVFYPFVHARLPPTVAAIAMALSSISVVMSSLTLRFYTPPDVMAVGGDNDVTSAATTTVTPTTVTSSTTTTRTSTNTTTTTTARRRSIDENYDLRVALLSDAHQNEND